MDACAKNTDFRSLSRSEENIGYFHPLESMYDSKKWKSDSVQFVGDLRKRDVPTSDSLPFFPGGVEAAQQAEDVKWRRPGILRCSAEQACATCLTFADTDR